MDNRLVVTIYEGKHHIIVATLKVLLALLILPLSLLLYLAGIILTITIIGALIGIPLIVSTYALDILAFSALMNPRSKTIKVNCPNCKKGKYVIPFAMESYRCKQCKELIKVTVEG
jgi:ribosomal protein S27E